jgi:predicted small lipoprotein YifL
MVAGCAVAAAIGLIRRPATPRSLNMRRRIFSARSAVSALIVVTLAAGCGKKGPPLPPLVKLPSAPEKLLADRRGNTVDLQFTVPSTNTDGTRPANISRAEVYAVTAPPLPTPLTDEQLLKLGTKVGEVAVKAPRDPNRTADADDPADEVEAPEGPGLAQGAIVRLQEPLSAAALTPIDMPDEDNTGTASDDGNGASQPLLAPARVTLTRTYVAYGTTTRGRKGPLSPRTEVPLVPPPPPPQPPAIGYDEKSVTLNWTAVGSPRGVEPSSDGGVLPSTPIGDAPASIAYNVYDATDAATPVKLTPTPIAEPTFVDTRMTWGQKRCYTVRTAETIGGFTIESDAAEPHCETLIDTFPPAAPRGVQGIPSEGAINLIWQPNAESDLAGYLVLRAASPGEQFEPITPAPIPETLFKDDVPRGVPYVYTVKAVDRAGNASAPSARVTETAR